MITDAFAFNVKSFTYSDQNGFVRGRCTITIIYLIVFHISLIVAMILVQLYAGNLFLKCMSHVFKKQRLI